MLKLIRLLDYNIRVIKIKMIFVTTDSRNINRAKPEHILNKMRRYRKQKYFLVVWALFEYFINKITKGFIIMKYNNGLVQQ